MEQVTVTHPDNTTLNLTSAEYMRYVKTFRHVVTNQASDYVEVVVDAASKIAFQVGDTLSVGGNTYRLNTLPRVEKVGTRMDGLMTYRCEFESRKYDLRYITFMLPEGGRTDVFTGTLGEWVALVVRNINRVLGQYANANESQFLANVTYYSHYYHPSELKFLADVTYYKEMDTVSGRDFVQMTAGTDYNIGDYILIWEQNQGNNPDYEPVRAMRYDAGNYFAAVYGVDYYYGLAMVSSAFFTRTEVWQVGECPNQSTYITKDFGGHNCLAVLQEMCAETGYEYRITETGSTFTINIVQPEDVDLTLQFGRGKGLYSITRDVIAADAIITRMYAYGSTDNLYSSYRYGRLCLPGMSKEESFIENTTAVQMYGLKEGVVTYDNIKPEYNGQVTAIDANNALVLYDVGIHFNLSAVWANTDEDYAEWLMMRGLDDSTESRSAFQAAVGDSKYLIAGTSPKVHFNSGNLAGYEFEISAFDFTNKKVTLIADSNTGFPYIDSANAANIAVGDNFVFVDIYLPYSYIEDAEQRLLSAATDDYGDMAYPIPVYEVKLTRGWVQMYHHQTADILTAGNYVTLYDADTDADDDIKIQGYIRNYLTEDEYEITLTNKRRETYWERWFRRNHNNLANNAFIDRPNGADSNNVGMFTISTNVDDNPNTVRVTGGKLVTWLGNISDIPSGVFQLATQEAHIVVVNANKKVSAIPASMAANALATGRLVQIGVISAVSNNSRTASLMGVQANVPHTNVTVGGDTMDDYIPALRAYDSQQQGKSGVLYYGVYNGKRELWVWDNGEYVMIGSTIPVPITGVEFDNQYPDINAEGSYSFSASVVPSNTTDIYTLDYSITSDNAESITTSDDDLLLHYTVDGQPVVITFSTTTGLLSIPNFSGNLTDHIFVTVQAVVDSATVATDSQECNININN